MNNINVNNLNLDNLNSDNINKKGQPQGFAPTRIQLIIQNK